MVDVTVARRGTPLLLVLMFLPAGAAVEAQAPPRQAPPPSGLYEMWSPIERRPVGPLRAPPPALVRWLDVRTDGDRSEIVFEPERRMVWQVTWGPHGVIEKVTEVDGERFSRSRFRYEAGRLVEKVVDGPAIDGTLRARFRTDGAGRVIERTEELSLRRARHTTTSFRAYETPVAARWTVRWRGRSAVATQVAGREWVRRDTFGGGLLRRTDFRSRTDAGDVRASLVYVRAATGELLAVDRIVDGRRSRARPGRRDARVSVVHLGMLHEALVERHEALLLLGAPVTHTDEARGRERQLTDDYSDGCWLNAISTLAFDATGLLVGGRAACVCGFCVDAELQVEAEDVRAIDLHWTSGPWVRLDGRIDLTADHEVMTPAGPRQAGELAPGDAVLGADGSVRLLQSVELLDVSEPRLGRNVRTASGVFAAGGLLVVSEEPRACPTAWRR